MALREVIKNPDAFFQRSDIDFLRHYENAADRFRDDRAAIGTNVHEILEAELTNAWEIPEIYDPEVAQCIDQWHIMMSEHEFKPLWVETTLVNEETGYMGTADYVGWVDGVLACVDFKTSRKIHEENHLQLSALTNATHALIPVAEGTPGAVYYEKDRSVNGEKRKESAWFVKEEMPKIESKLLFHLRPDEVDPLLGTFVPAFNDIVESPMEHDDLLFRKFQGLTMAWHAGNELSIRRKQ